MTANSPVQRRSSTASSCQSISCWRRRWYRRSGRQTRTKIVSARMRYRTTSLRSWRGLRRDGWRWPSRVPTHEKCLWNGWKKMEIVLNWRTLYRHSHYIASTHSVWNKCCFVLTNSCNKWYKFNNQLYLVIVIEWCSIAVNFIFYNMLPTFKIEIS